MTFLTDEEVEHLTGKHRWSAQVRALVSMGIRFERRPDGKPVVTRTAVHSSNDSPAKAEPKWDAA